MTYSAVAIVLSVVLAVYGLYASSYISGLLVGNAAAILLIGRAIEAALAFAAALGVWTRRAWAPAGIVALALAIAAMWLVEGFVLGIVAYLYAIGAAILVAAVGLVCAWYLQQHQRSAPSGSSPLTNRRSA
jgi:hypothetical protein